MLNQVLILKNNLFSYEKQRGCNYNFWKLIRNLPLFSSFHCLRSVNEPWILEFALTTIFLLKIPNILLWGRSHNLWINTHFTLSAKLPFFLASTIITWLTKPRCYKYCPVFNSFVTCFSLSCLLFGRWINSSVTLFIMLSHCLLICFLLSLSLSGSSAILLRIVEGQNKKEPHIEVI